MTIIQRGQVYWVNLNHSHGTEIHKVRPCVVMSANAINRARRTVVVIPLSSSPTPSPPITIPITFQDKEAVAVVDQIRVIDKTRLKRLAGMFTPKQMFDIENALKQVLALPQ